MTTEATTTPITRESLQKALTEAQATFEAKQTAYKTEMSKGTDADDDAIESLITARKVARNAISAAQSALDTFASNESWQALTATLRPVNRALEALASNGLPTPTANGMTGDVSIAEDGTVTVNARVTFDAEDLADVKSRIRTLIESARDDFKARNVKGFTFKLVKGENGFAPSISPSGAKVASSKATGGSTTSVAGGKGSNAYTDPAGKVHTAREAIEALRSTYSGKQESIDNALATGNGVRNIAVQLCNKNGWTIAKA